MILLTSIFSRTKDDANADNTRKDVETGIPFLVSKIKAKGSKAWYH